MPDPDPDTSTRNDLRGAVRLAADATTGVADIVEAMHAGIARLPGTPVPPRTRGLSGLIYGAVRGVARGVGRGADGLLALWPERRGGGDARAGGERRDALVAALNGVLGDHLEASANPLAIAMGLRHDGRPLVLDRPALQARLPHAGDQLLVLLHGLCMNDRQWRRRPRAGSGDEQPDRPAHDHGAALAHDLGFTPLYLRYNSGRAIAANGRTLAALLEQLIDSWPQPPQRLVLLGHSMGGLVARSAVCQARQAGQRWPALLSDLVCLGTPHHGAPLERAGQVLTRVLGAAPYAAPLAGLTRVRSAGITDLRHGRVLDDPAAGGAARFGRAGRLPPVVPLPSGVRCHALAASTGERRGDLSDRLLGDGLVPLASALGQHADPARHLAFDPTRQWVAWGINHLDLLSDDGVYQRLRQALSPAAVAPPPTPARP